MPFEYIALLKGAVGLTTAIVSLANEGSRQKFSEAIFSETFGGIFADFTKDTARGLYDKLKDKYSKNGRVDRDSFNHDLQRASRKAQLVATFFAAQDCLEKVKYNNLPDEEKSRSARFYEKTKGIFIGKTNLEIYFESVIKYLEQEINNVETINFSGTLSAEEFVAIFDTFSVAVNQTSREKIALDLQSGILSELKELPTFLTNIQDDFNGFNILKYEIEEGWDELPKEAVISKNFVSLNLATPDQTSNNTKDKWFDMVCIIFNEEYKIDKKVKAAAQKNQSLKLERMLLEVSYKLDEMPKLKGISVNQITNQISTFANDLKYIREGIDKANQNIEEHRKESKEIGENHTFLLDAIRSELAEIKMNNDASGKNKKLHHYINFPANFIGREDILDELQKAYDKEKRKFVLHGIGGVGKSWICKEFAKRNKDTYASQFSVDMHGFSKENPLSPIEAMKQIILKFYDYQFDFSSLSESEIHQEFTSVIKQQSTMIILDNAENLESVEALCQDASTFILITSRNVIELRGRFDLEIKQMSEADSENLLFSIAGEGRFDGKAQELAKLAGYLPMALTVLASNLATDKFETVDNLIIKYQDVQRLFKERVPDYQNLTIDASFELSYKKLSDDLKLCWRWLSVSPSDFDFEAIKSISGASDEEAYEIRKELCNRSLIEYNPNTDRYKLHDLARKFADSKFDTDLSLFRRLTKSVLSWLAPKYAHQERLAAYHCHSGYFARTFSKAYEMKHNDYENGFLNALNLIDKEWTNITAGQKWAAEHAEMHPNYAETCCRYSSFSEFFDLRLTPQEAIEWQEISLKAAKMLGNKKREGLYLGNMGVAYRHLGEYEKAIECHKRSLEIAEQFNDEDGIGSALGNLAIVYGSSGQDKKKALELLESVLQIARETKNRKRESLTLGTLGSIYNGMGDFRKAIELQTQSLNIAREIGDLSGESIALGNLANAYHDLGDYKKAREYDEQALEISKKIGDKYGENLTLQNMNSPRNFSTFEEFENAIKNYEELLKVAHQTENLLDEFRCLYQLGMIYLELGAPPIAIEYLDSALTKARQIGDKEKELNCLGNLGNIFGMIGNDKLAIEICEQALQIAREIGDRSEEARNLHMLGLGYASLGEMKKACTFWKESLEIFKTIESPRAEMVRQLLIESRYN